MPDTSTQSNLERPRVVRVFVSSTFRDMQAERDELIKRVFPQLRKLCDQRGVVWGEVDLRWGITREEAERGEVLPICLEEIERCRPFFIGLLGERYGWVPDQIDPEVLERESWLSEYQGHSVTELEIVHGVLNSSEMTDHAFFYFRDPAFTDRIPAEKRSDFVEMPTPEEIRRYGEVEAERRASERREKLRALKSRIRDSGVRLRTDFADAPALGQLVLQDLTQVIDRLYPAASTRDVLDREIADHDAFARSRASVYIRRESLFDGLSSHVAGNGPPLVLVGESGVGKSALLANWALEYRNRHPDTPMVLHFIGASSDSADWTAMLRRIVGELDRIFHLGQAVPDEPAPLRDLFASVLTSIPTRIVLVLDGLNQLLDRDGAPDLVWLPPAIPSNVRLLLSTLPGRALDEIQRRDWPLLEVTHLRSPERKELIRNYLAQYTKKLNQDQIDRIAGARQTGNPLYLRALLEELRIFGEHETLAQRIDHYLTARSVPTLYQRILERYERDYERERPDLTRDAMSLLWAARRGLAESELVDLLGTGGEPLPRAYWSPLFLACENSLVNRGGLLGFSHDHFRQAVQSRYLSRQAQRQDAHLRLADYFIGREVNPRRIDEQPWQLARAAAWKRLSYLLTDLPFFEAAWKQNRSEVKSCWTQIEENSDLRVRDAYQPLVEKLSTWQTPYVPLGWSPTAQMTALVSDQPPSENALWGVSELLSDLGHATEAMRIRDWLKKRFEARGDRGSLSIALGGQALILKSRGELKEAYELFKQQEQISRDTGNEESLIGALIGQAQILEARGRLDQAMELCAEAERMSVAAGNQRAQLAAIGNQASLLHLRGQTDRALERYRQQEKIAKELNEKDGLFIAITNQGLMLNTKGQAEGALALFKQGERIAREIGNRMGVAASLGYQARNLVEAGKVDDAMALLEEKEQICKDLGDQKGLAATYQLRGEVFQKKGDPLRAMQSFREEERIAREFDYQYAVYNALTGQARLHQEARRIDEALYLLREAEILSDESPLQLCSVLRQHSEALKARGDFEEALKKLARAEQVCNETGNRAELLHVLSNIAAVHLERNDFPKALDTFRREEPLATELNDRKNLEICRIGLQTCVAIMADHHSDNGRPADALRDYRELETRARQNGDKEYLVRSLEGQADSLVACHEIEAGLLKLEELEQLDRQSGDRKVLATCLLKQATIAVDAGKNLDRAAAKVEEAAKIFEELALNLHAAQADAILVRIRSGLSGSRVKIIGIVFMLLMAAGGVALGRWKTWLWIVGAPIVLFAAFNLLLTISPSLQRKWNNYVRKMMASRRK